MNIIILKGSPRKNGNTNSIVDIAMEVWKEEGHSIKEFDLYDLEIKPCIACRNCQKDWMKFGCIHKDDVQEIFDVILESNLMVLATPIYSWYCTAPMKALLDRLVYGMNKYYGDSIGPSLWEGRSIALLSTGGYPEEMSMDLWTEGMRRYAKHSKLSYIDGLYLRHRSYKEEFMNEEKRQSTIDFAQRISAVMREKK